MRRALVFIIMFLAVAAQAATITFVSPLAGAQVIGPTALEISADSAKVDRVALVEVPLRARSSKPLRASDLRVRENGIEQTIRDVKIERPAAHFAFVVDRSLSMNDGKLEAALRAIESELRLLRAGDTASLVAFNRHVAKARAITRGQQLSTRELTPSGGTSLRDALASAASRERTYAIVITDGGDRTSQRKGYFAE